jgi:hypothetical protein
MLRSITASVFYLVFNSCLAGCTGIGEILFNRLFFFINFKDHKKISGTSCRATTTEFINNK